MCYVEAHRGLSRHTAHGSQPIAPPLYRMEEKRRDGHHMLSDAGAPTKTGHEYVKTAVRKRWILFAGFVTRMGNERLPKRVMFGEVDRGKVYSGGQEQDWMGCLERDLSLFNLPTEAKHWTLAAKKLCEWFRRVEEAAKT